jgi:exodeoxyribonuclease VII large subunit
MARALASHRDRLERARARRVLTDPARPLRDLTRRLDDARARLRRAALAAVGRAERRVALADRGLRVLSPVARTINGRRALTDLEARLGRAVHRRLDRARHGLGGAAGRLDSLSPLAVLGRGYSLTRTPDGRIVRSWREVGAGDAVRVVLHEGSLDCRVDATREHDDRPQV